MRHHLLKFLLVPAVAGFLAGMASAQPPSDEPLPEIGVFSASEDAGGWTQADLGPDALKMLEKRSVEMLEAKTRAYLKAQGQSTQLPKFQSEAHYMQAGSMKLAIVRIRVPNSVNQVLLYGIKGTELRRVACVRTKNIEESIPLFYGPCGDRVREVYGVSIAPR